MGRSLQFRAGPRPSYPSSPTPRGPVAPGVLGIQSALHRLRWGLTAVQGWPARWTRQEPAGWWLREPSLQKGHTLGSAAVPSLPPINSQHPIHKATPECPGAESSRDSRCQAGVRSESDHDGRAPSGDSGENLSWWLWAVPGRMAASLVTFPDPSPHVCVQISPFLMTPIICS